LFSACACTNHTVEIYSKPEYISFIWPNARYRVWESLYIRGCTLAPRTTEPCMCSGDAALCQITLTTCLQSFALDIASVTVEFDVKRHSLTLLPVLPKSEVVFNGQTVADRTIYCIKSNKKSGTASSLCGFRRISTSRLGIGAIVGVVYRCFWATVTSNGPPATGPFSCLSCLSCL